MIGMLEGVDGDLVAPARPELGGLVHWAGAGGRPIHRWFRYREGFSPALIGELGLGRRILDPFCGSGSIMVGAAQQGRASLGIDVNPLAAFVARVKLSPLSAGDLAATEDFLDCSTAATAAEPWPAPPLRIAGKVFEPEIMAALLRLRGAIEERAATKQQRNFLLLAWLSILQDVGSYFKEGNGIKYRNRQRRPGGYVARPDGAWQRARFGADQTAFVHAAFKAQLAAMLADTAAWHDSEHWSAQRVVEGDALEETAPLEPATFDSVLFSPPYANRFDYFESQKVELWFGGFVDGYDELRALRKRSLRSHLGADLDRAVDRRSDVETLIAAIDPESYAARTAVPALIRGYFSDMGAILRRCRRVLVSGGRCFVVVGNSAYGGVIIPTDALVARLGLEAGFRRAQVVPVRHLTVAPQQRRTLQGGERWMRESVVVLS